MSMDLWQYVAVGCGVFFLSLVGWGAVQFFLALGRISRVETE